MRDQELELIAALVEGRLEDETQARALIESAPEYRSEYEAQMVAYEALSSVPAATLSETERAALHRDVWTELRTPGTSPAGQPAPWYYRWVPVAAGMFVVVGLVAVINQGGSSDSTQLAAEFDLSVTTTAAATASGGDDSAESAQPEEAGSDGAESDVPASEDEGSGSTLPLTLDFARVLSPSGEDFFAAEAARVRDGVEEDYLVRSLEDDSATDQLQNCVDQSGLEGYEAVSANPSPASEEGAVPAEVSPYIVAIPSEANPTTAPVAFVELFSCKVLYLDE